jgi:hypothetical protein
MRNSYETFEEIRRIILKNYIFNFCFLYGKNTGKNYLISAEIFSRSFPKNLGNFWKLQEISREKNEKSCRYLEKKQPDFFSRGLKSKHHYITEFFFKIFKNKSFLVLLISEKKIFWNIFDKPLQT